MGAKIKMRNEIYDSFAVRVDTQSISAAIERLFSKCALQSLCAKIFASIGEFNLISDVCDPILPSQTSTRKSVAGISYGTPTNLKVFNQLEETEETEVTVTNIETTEVTTKTVATATNPYSATKDVHAEHALHYPGCKQPDSHAAYSCCQCYDSYDTTPHHRTQNDGSGGDCRVSARYHRTLLSGRERRHRCVWSREGRGALASGERLSRYGTVVAHGGTAGETYLAKCPDAESAMGKPSAGRGCQAAIGDSECAIGYFARNERAESDNPSSKRTSRQQSSNNQLWK